MTLQNYRYELDKTGVNPNNLVQNEPVTLGGTAVRVLIPTYGAFYAESFSITDTATGLALNNTQFYFSQPAHMPSMMYGKSIYYCAVITDPNVSANVSISYQALGGEGSYSNSALAEQIQRTIDAYRSVNWNDILNIPARFAPGSHLHAAGDIYGFEYITEAIYAVRDAIANEDTARAISIYDRLLTSSNLAATTISQLRVELQQAITIWAAAQAELALSAGPGGPTATQLNQRMAAAEQAIQRLVNADEHIALFTNPHKVTQAQVGLSKVRNFELASEQDIANTFENFADIISSWVKFSHGTVGDQSETAQWLYNDATKSVGYAINSVNTNGIVSDKSFGDYIFEVELSSIHFDDDTIGIVLGFVVGQEIIIVNGQPKSVTVEYTLCANRYLNRTTSTFALVYRAAVMDAEYVAEHGTNLMITTYIDTNMGGTLTNEFINPERIVGTALGWSGKRVKILASKTGNLIEASTSQFNLSGVCGEIIPATKLSLDLSSQPYLLKFIDSSRIGFTNMSQPSAIWAVKQLPWWRNDRYMTPALVQKAIEYVVPSTFYNVGGEGQMLKVVNGELVYVDFPPDVLHLACSDDASPIEVKAGKVNWRASEARVLVGIRASLKTAATGSAVIVDLKVNGASCLSTKLSIDATEESSVTAASQAVISSPLIPDDAKLSVDIVQVGSTFAGDGLMVYIYWRRS